MSTPKAPKKDAAAVALGRRGGSRNTEAQQKARKALAAQNLTGRPGRVCTTCGEPVLGGHKDTRLNATCAGREWTWAPARRTKKGKHRE